MMDDKCDVSVVIPSYNSEAFIRRSVGSVLEQTGVSVQLIVVDDEGTDDTRPILEAIKAENPDKQIEYIYRGSGLGQATARNDGMEIARGRYIALLDSDDSFCEPDTLAKWVAFADKNELDIAGAQFYTIPAATGERRPARPLVMSEDKPVTVVAEPRLANVTSCWQLLYNREFLQKNDITFSKKLKQREDRLFVMQAFLVAQKIGVSSQFVVDHFIIPGSSYKQVDLNQLQQYIQHLRELNHYLEESRRAGRNSDEFELANAAIYFLQILTYWHKIFIDIYKDPTVRPIILELCDELNKLTPLTRPFFAKNIFEVAGQMEHFLLEGVVDLLRIAIRQNQFDFVLRILKRERLLPVELKPLLDGTDDTEEVCARYLSFHRDWMAGKSKPIIGMTPLRDLVGRVILHIGMTKTGSSTLQQTIERNRFRLMERGIYYPVSGAFRERGIRRERTPGHARLFQRIMDGDDVAISELCGELEGLGRRVDTLILSAENILSPRFWFQGEGFRKIVSAIGVDDIEVMCVFRKQDEWIFSSYSEMCANPWNQFTQPAEKYIETVEADGLLDYESVFATLNSPARVKNVYAGSFENIKNQGGIIPWFRDAMGIEDEWAEIDRQFTNESIHKYHVTLVKLLKSAGALTREEMTEAFQIILSSKPMNVVRDTIIDGEVLDAFNERNEKYIRAYCEKHGVPYTKHKPSSPAKADIAVPIELYKFIVNRTPQAPKAPAKGEAKREAGGAAKKTSPAAAGSRNEPPAAKAAKAAKGAAPKKAAAPKKPAKTGPKAGKAAPKAAKPAPRTGKAAIQKAAVNASVSAKNNDTQATLQALMKELEENEQLNERLRNNIKYKVFKTLYSNFMKDTGRKKLERDPQKFFREGRRPGARIGRLLLRDQLKR